MYDAITKVVEIEDGMHNFYLIKSTGLADLL